MPASSLKREQPHTNPKRQRGTCGWSSLTLRVGVASPASAFLKLSNAIAEPGRVFVSLSGDRLLQLLAQLNQLRLGLFILRQTARRLAAVADLAVNILQERSEFFP